MNAFLQTIKDSIYGHSLLEPGAQVIVGLSGGADSVALLSALTRLGYHCVAASCNFHLRGDESDRDREFARNIAKRLGAEFHTVDFDTRAYTDSHPGTSVEMACRELRYDWFATLSRQMGGLPLAVAHHRDDNVETFMLNLLRGTGLSGLRAMQPRSVTAKQLTVIRPMLSASRAMVEEYLAEEGLGYVIDSSNLVADVRRNRIRLEVLPAIRSSFPDADARIADTIANLASTESLYHELIDRSLRREYESADATVIDLPRLKSEISDTVTALYEMLRGRGFNASQCRDILSATQAGATILSATHRATLTQSDTLLIDEASADSIPQETEIDFNGPLPDGFTATLSDREQVAFDRNGRTLWLDASALDGNPRFILRPWREADRIAPYGMKHGTRLVSDILAEARIPLSARRRRMVLERDGVILWVVGLRASRHFPVTAATAAVLSIKISPEML